MRCSSAPRATAPSSIVDSEPELERAARAGVERVGLRVALPGIGVEPTRFGIAPAMVPDGRRARTSPGPRTSRR